MNKLLKKVFSRTVVTALLIVIQVGQLPASDTDRAAHTEPCCDFVCDKKRYEPIV